MGLRPLDSGAVPMSMSTQDDPTIEGDTLPASLHVRLLPADELERHLPVLVGLLTEAVNLGAGLGFLAPLSREDACDYWLSQRAEIRSGARLLLAATIEGRIVGSGQLALVPWATARHRAEIQKLVVADSVRGRGVGRALLAGLHGTARRQGRSLMLLNTRRGGRPEGFYKRLGYRELGVLPGGALGPAGERLDIVTLYRDLSASSPG